MTINFQVTFSPKLILSFVVAVSAFTLALKVNDTKAQTNSSTGMPTSGSCALMLTMPVPYGWTSMNNSETGYNLLGKLTFASSTAAVFNGVVVNPRYRTNNSPSVDPADNFYLRNTPVTIQTMTSTNGFEGGYKLAFAINSTQIFYLNAVLANNSKTILLQSNGGIEPASGVCQI